jgi:hypothetical protein
MSTNHYDQSLLNKSKKDKFILTISLPPDLRDYNKKLERANKFFDLDSLQFSVYGSVVPENTVPAEGIRYAGSTVFVSSHNKPTYDPITVNFTIDNEFKNYWVIQKWLNLMRDEETGIFSGTTLPKDNGLGRYSSDFILTAKDEFHNDVIQWTFKSAFPISLGEINYNYRDGAEIETTFKFVFRRIETILL